MKYTKRKDGRYYARIYIGQQDGKKVYKHIYANSFAELEEKYMSQKLMTHKGVDILKIDDSLNSWIQRFNQVRELSTTKTAHRTEVSRLQYFQQSIGTMKLKDISQHHIQEIILDLFRENPTTHQPSSKKTLTNYLLAISMVFEFAIENRATEFNPCKYVKLPRNAVKNERRALSHKEIQEILETPHTMQICAVLGLCGLRRGEAAALLWSDVDLINKTISINKSYDFESGAVKPPKTKSSYRMITIPDFAYNIIASQEHSSIYVCHNEGKMYNNAKWTREWNKYLWTLNDKYGTSFEVNGQKFMSIQPFTMHELRHTCSTLLYESGVDILTHQRFLGHSDAQTSLNVYTHLDAISNKLDISNLNTLVEKIKLTAENE